MKSVFGRVRIRHNVSYVLACSCKRGRLYFSK